MTKSKIFANNETDSLILTVDSAMNTFFFYRFDVLPSSTRNKESNAFSVVSKSQWKSLNTDTDFSRRFLSIDYYYSTEYILTYHRS